MKFCLLFMFTGTAANSCSQQEQTCHWGLWHCHKIDHNSPLPSCLLNAKDPQRSVSLTIKFEVSPKMSFYFYHLLNRRYKHAYSEVLNGHLQQMTCFKSCTLQDFHTTPCIWAWSSQIGTVLKPHIFLPGLVQMEPCSGAKVTGAPWTKLTNKLDHKKITIHFKKVGCWPINNS